MGAGVSKQAGKSARTLSKRVDQPIKLAKKVKLEGETTKNSHGSSAASPLGEARVEPQDVDPEFYDRQVSQRLHKLGVVQFEPVKQKYETDNSMLSAIKTRQELDLKTKMQIESQRNDSNVAQTLIGAETITAILESRQRGKSDAQISQELNVAPQVLNVIGKDLGIPRHRVVVKERVQVEDQSGRRAPNEAAEGEGEVLER